MPARSTVSPETMARALREAASAGPLWLEASGESMGRAILPGGRVLVAAHDRPRRGQIWAFCVPASVVVVHRCVGRRGDRYRFRGDTSRREDDPVPAACLVGRVEAVGVPGGRVRHLGRRSEVAGRARIWAQRVRRVAGRSGRNIQRFAKREHNS
jgi:hypothetical protein